MLDDALEEKEGGGREHIGMVVIRGNAVVMLEVSLASSTMVTVALTHSRHSTVSTQTSTREEDIEAGLFNKEHMNNT